MKIGVYVPLKLPESFRVYYQSVSSILRAKDIDLVEFDSIEKIPHQADIIWDIRSGGGSPPPEMLLNIPAPIVVTIHGVATMDIPLWSYFKGWRGIVKGFISNRRKRKKWVAVQKDVACIIAVSKYGKRSIHRHLKIPLEKIHVCHHGVDQNLYVPSQSPNKEYLLHISNGEPRKNIRRILAAYKRWNSDKKPPLLLKVPANVERLYGSPDGVEYLHERLTDEQIKALYDKAIGFLFPSLYEGFGLPILEAMSSGCPVITSNKTACAEVAGSAGILINPRSLQDLSRAMNRLCRDEEYRIHLIEESIRHAKNFTWQKSAEAHAEVFYSLGKVD